MAVTEGLAGSEGTGAGGVTGKPDRRPSPGAAGPCARPFLLNSTFRLRSADLLKGFSAAGASAAGSAFLDRDQVLNARLDPRDFDLDNAGRSSAPRITTSAAAMPTGISHRTGRQRGGANSLGATVLKCCSSFWRRWSLSLSGVGWPVVCAAGLVMVSRTRLMVCFSRS